MSRQFWKTIIVIGWLVGFVLAFVYSNSGGHPFLEYVQFSVVGVVVFAVLYVLYMFATKQAPGDPEDDGK